jgi:SAM-dependent methyltransferase
MNLKNAYDRAIFRMRNQGILSLLHVSGTKVLEFFFPPKSKYYGMVCERINGARGLEIGGPSRIFSANGFIPVYPVASELDNMNFASNTIWEGEIKSSTFIVDGKILGKQFIGEASILSDFKDSQYDFLLSSEMIQHIANPLRAIYEWKRVLKKDGLLILIVPNMEKTFDHKRPLTKLEHIIDDYDHDTQETDLTHLEEVLVYHDLSRDRPAGTYDQFKQRCENNFRVRALHHHVYTKESALRMTEYAGFNVLGVELFKSTIVFLLQKSE